MTTDPTPPASGTRHARELLNALNCERGAIVSSADCCEMEIAFARTDGRFFVDDDGIGYVLRLKDWRANAEQLIFDARENDDG